MYFKGLMMTDVVKFFTIGALSTLFTICLAYLFQDLLCHYLGTWGYSIALVAITSLFSLKLQAKFVFDVNINLLRYFLFFILQTLIAYFTVIINNYLTQLYPSLSHEILVASWSFSSLFSLLFFAIIKKIEAA